VSGAGDVAPPDTPALEGGGATGGGSGQFRHAEYEAWVGDFGSGVQTFMPSEPSMHVHVVRWPRSHASPMKSGAPMAIGGRPAEKPSGDVAG
jgi:hypothetical protein